MILFRLFCFLYYHHDIIKLGHAHQTTVGAIVQSFLEPLLHSFSVSLIRNALMRCWLHIGTCMPCQWQSRYALRYLAAVRNLHNDQLYGSDTSSGPGSLKISLEWNAGRLRTLFTSSILRQCPLVLLTSLIRGSFGYPTHPAVLFRLFLTWCINMMFNSGLML